MFNNLKRNTVTDLNYDDARDSLQGVSHAISVYSDEAEKLAKKSATAGNVYSSKTTSASETAREIEAAQQEMQAAGAVIQNIVKELLN